LSDLLIWFIFRPQTILTVW